MFALRTNESQNFKEYPSFASYPFVQNSLPKHHLTDNQEPHYQRPISDAKKLFNVTTRLKIRNWSPSSVVLIWILSPYDLLPNARNSEMGKKFLSVFLFLNVVAGIFPSFLILKHKLTDRFCFLKYQRAVRCYQAPRRDRTSLSVWLFGKEKSRHAFVQRIRRTGAIWGRAKGIKY